MKPVCQKPHAGVEHPINNKGAKQDESCERRAQLQHIRHHEQKRNLSGAPQDILPEVSGGIYQRTSIKCDSLRQTRTSLRVFPTRQREAAIHILHQAAKNQQDEVATA